MSRMMDAPPPERRDLWAMSEVPGQARDGRHADMTFRIADTPRPPSRGLRAMSEVPGQARDGGERT